MKKQTEWYAIKFFIEPQQHFMQQKRFASFWPRVVGLTFENNELQGSTIKNRMNEIKNGATCVINSRTNQRQVKYKLNALAFK